MSWLIVTSYRRNYRKYLYAILSLILTTFLATISAASVEFAGSMWKVPFLEYGGGHILVRMSEPEDTWSLWHPNRVFDGDQATSVIREVFPEATVTFLLIVPVNYDNNSNYRMSNTKEIIGRSGGLDLWYLFPKTRAGLQLTSVPVSDSSVVVGSGYGRTSDNPNTLSSTQFPDIGVQVARYVGTDYPWRLVNASTQSLKVLGTHYGAVYSVYMHLEALRIITGCPDNTVSMIGILLPGIQHRINAGRLEKLESRLSEDIPGLEVVTVDEVGRESISELRILEEAPRKYLPIIYAISFAVVGAIIASVAQSRRREMLLLHVIGLSRSHVRLLFAMECMIATASAGLVGYFPVLAIGRLVLNTSQISVLPLAITLAGSVLIVALRSAFLLKDEEPIL